MDKTLPEVFYLLPNHKYNIMVDVVNYDEVLINDFMPPAKGDSLVMKVYPTTPIIYH